MPVKYQMQCGSCMASVATLEVCLMKVNAILSDYAELEFIDCTTMTTRRLSGATEQK
jgi:hypothetical protein